MLELAFEHPQWALSLTSAVLLGGLALLEGLISFAFGKKLYTSKDTACNLAMFAGSLCINLFWAHVVFHLYVQIHQYSPWKLGRQWWLFEGNTRPWEWLALFILEDLCFYAFHRCSHHFRVLWASHVNHHSSEKFNFTTAFRQTWTPFSAVLFWLPLAWLGFDPLMILCVQTLSLTYQSWLHTQLISRLGPLEWVLNTPSHHRVHHGHNARYLDKNFGGVLIIWDRLFGTFQKEEEPVSFGLVERLRTYNPFKVAFHEWAALLRKPRLVPGWVPILPLCLASTGCEANVRKFHEARLLSHLSGLKSYQGVFSETGVLAKQEKLVSEIRFSRPGSYFIRVLSPQEFEGTVFAYSGSRLVLFYPITHYAIEFLNLQPFSIPEQEQLLKDQLHSNFDHYVYELGSTSRVAGLPAVDLSFEAQTLKSRVRSGQSQVYDPFSFPLALSMTFGKAEKYGYRYEKISFNQAGQDRDLDFQIPKGTLVSRWDVSSKNYSQQQAEQELGLSFRTFSGKLHRQLGLKKLIRQQGPVPAFTFLYENRPYFLNLTVFKDYGVSLIPSGHGLRLKDKKNGTLIPGLHGSTYSFEAAGIHYIVSGNLPLEELLHSVDEL